MPLREALGRATEIASIRGCSPPSSSVGAHHSKAAAHGEDIARVGDVEAAAMPSPSHCAWHAREAGGDGRAVLWRACAGRTTPSSGIVPEAKASCMSRCSPTSKHPSGRWFSGNRPYRTGADEADPTRALAGRRESGEIDFDRDNAAAPGPRASGKRQPDTRARHAQSPSLQRDDDIAAGSDP